jgi:NAD(P)-dependent dehydrogenase (short-subunit alcohol dehydrogenase family)
MPIVDFSLKDRVAIVTGGSRGIGRAIALALAEAGAGVVVASRTPQANEEVAKEIRSMGGKALGVPADARQADQVASLVERTLEGFGRIDVLVNNAGGSFGETFNRGPLMEISERDFDETLAVNLKSVFLCSRAAGRVMLERGGGSIVNVASEAGRIPTPGFGAYGAAKAGVINLTLSLAQELAPSIRVNAVAPGPIETPRTSGRKSPEVLARQQASIILGRVGQPEDVAAAVLYLASDAAKWVTGTIIDIHGGQKRY